MTEFVRAAADFPAVIPGLLLVVVLVYWLLVATGALDVVAGVVTSAAVSLFILLTWFGGLVGTVLAHRHHVAGPVPAAGVLAGSLVLSALVTRLALRPLRYLVPDERVPSRHDFVGRMCVIRTRRVDLTFGQADVRAADGAAAVIQVRQQRNQPGEAPLERGSTALIFDYDAVGQFFWVMPYDADLDPNRPLR